MTSCPLGAARTSSRPCRTLSARTRPWRSPTRSGARLAVGPAVKLLKVIHLGKYYPPASGGIETHTRTLALSQAASGADVRVLVINHATADGRDVTFETFAVTPDAADIDGPVRIHRAGRWGCLAKLDVTPSLPTILG